MSGRRAYPLALQLLTGLLLNFLLVAALFVALPGQGGVGWDVLLTTTVRERLLTVGDRLAAQLASAPQSEWPALLAKAGTPGDVRFSVRDDLGPGGEHGGLPPDHGEPPPGFGPGGPDAFHGPGGPGGPPPPGHRPGGGPQPDRTVLADMINVQRLGWREGFVVRIPMQVGGRPVDLEAHAAGCIALLRFLGVADWVLFALLCLLATAAVWAPFAWRLSRAVTALTDATRTIAEGRFDVRVKSARRDELGQLADSVNEMAARLDRALETQKQFVADVAHEVTAPLARLRVGLELLGPAADARSARVQGDLQEDAEQMSALLDELLLFSRTGQATAREPAAACELGLLLQAALEQEAPDAESLASIELQLPAALRLQVPRALVQRALANLIRNALRYGQRGIDIQAEAVGDLALIRIRDRGPGVPEAALARLGEPFYRPDAARAREQGGTGLGLAIVRRCIAAADGRVWFRNRTGGGFEAVLELPLAR